jgi:hypothetical protein
LETRDGSVWIDYPEGVARYRDGQWRNFSTDDGLADREINNLIETADGAVWVATAGGASRFNGQTWQAFTAADGLADNKINQLLETTDGSLWAATADGASRFDGQSWQSFSTGRAVNDFFALLEATDGSLWFLSFNSGVSRFDGQSWQSFTTADGLGNNDVRSMVETADGSLWIRSTKGVSRYQRPGRPLVQTRISRAPPPLLGSDRFFFEFNSVEIGSDRQPVMEYALVRGSTVPQTADWSGFEEVSGYEATALDNGVWSMHVRSIDRHGNVDPTPAKVTFEVDITAPTVVISAPSGIVHGQVEIAGSVFDNSPRQDLQSFALEYARGATADLAAAVWSRDRLGDLGEAPIIDGRLGVWNTAGLRGPYVLRLTATDRLGHFSRFVQGVRIVAAVAQIDPRRGGHVRDSAAEVELYIPPNGIGSAIQVTIAPLDQNELELPADSRPSFAGPAYYIGPDTLKLVRPAILSLTLPAERSLEQPALYAWSGSGREVESAGWHLRGGEQAAARRHQRPGDLRAFRRSPGTGRGPGAWRPGLPAAHAVAQRGWLFVAD